MSLEKIIKTSVPLIAITALTYLGFDELLKYYPEANNIPFKILVSAYFGTIIGLHLSAYLNKFYK